MLGVALGQNLPSSSTTAPAGTFIALPRGYKRINTVFIINVEYADAAQDRALWYNAMVCDAGDSDAIAQIKLWAGAFPRLCRLLYPLSLCATQHRPLTNPRSMDATESGFIQTCPVNSTLLLRLFTLVPVRSIAFRGSNEAHQFSHPPISIKWRQCWNSSAHFSGSLITVVNV